MADTKNGQGGEGEFPTKIKCQLNSGPFPVIIEWTIVHQSGPQGDWFYLLRDMFSYQSD